MEDAFKEFLQKRMDAQEQAEQKANEAAKTREAQLQEWRNTVQKMFEQVLGWMEPYNTMGVQSRVGQDLERMTNEPCLKVTIENTEFTFRPFGLERMTRDVAMYRGLQPYGTISYKDDEWFIFISNKGAQEAAITLTKENFTQMLMARLEK